MYLHYKIVTEMFLQILFKILYVPCVRQKNYVSLWQPISPLLIGLLPHLRAFLNSPLSFNTLEADVSLQRETYFFWGHTVFWIGVYKWMTSLEHVFLQRLAQPRLKLIWKVWVKMHIKSGMSSHLLMRCNRVRWNDDELLQID